MQTEETRSWKEKIYPAFDELISEVEPQTNKIVLNHRLHRQKIQIICEI